MSQDLSETSIAERRAAILERIALAAKSSGRSAGEITFVAVSKQQPDQNVAAALAAGHRVFGENRVQEAAARWDERFMGHRDQIELRLIGPLQTNKAVDACSLFDVIETLDRMKLAGALIKAAEKTGRMPRLFVQVNIGAEDQKSGVLPGDLSGFLKSLKSEYDITPEGLMCIPPLGEAASPHFWYLANLAENHGIQNLSMGMSSDYETAIKMGATHIRIGSAFLGVRG
ncbi:MAG: YggS family pyridoxal phosphate-dependent enzyme [Hellea sp.]|nr:YggS family pyridoxal phosphate-dependent enzyme [Hellea sp.]